MTNVVCVHCSFNGQVGINWLYNNWFFLNVVVVVCHTFTLKINSMHLAFLFHFQWLDFSLISFPFSFLSLNRCHSLMYCTQCVVFRLCRLIIMLDLVKLNSNMLNSFSKKWSLFQMIISFYNDFSLKCTRYQFYR